MSSLREIYKDSLERSGDLARISPSSRLRESQEGRQDEEVFRLGETKFPLKESSDSIAHSAAKGAVVGGILSLIAAGSFAYGIYYTFIGRHGKPPSKDQLISELEKKRFVNQLQLERNQRLKDANSLAMNRKLIATIEDVTSEIDSLRSYSDRGYSESAFGTVSKFALKHGKSALARLGPHMDKAGKAIGAGLQGLSKGASNVGEVVEKVARPIFTPSQVVGDSILRKSKNANLQRLGLALGHKNQARQFGRVVSLSKAPGQSTMSNLKGRGKAMGQLVGASVADKAIQGATVTAAGAAYSKFKGNPAPPEGGKPGAVAPQAPGQPAAPPNAPSTPGQKPPINGSAGPSPGPDYVMVFGQWKKRGGGTQPARAQ